MAISVGGKYRWWALTGLGCLLSTTICLIVGLTQSSLHPLSSSDRQAIGGVFKRPWTILAPALVIALFSSSFMICSLLIHRSRSSSNISVRRQQVYLPPLAFFLSAADIGIFLFFLLHTSWNPQKRLSLVSLPPNFSIPRTCTLIKALDALVILCASLLPLAVLREGSSCMPGARHPRPPPRQPNPAFDTFPNIRANANARAHAQAQLDGAIPIPDSEITKAPLAPEPESSAVRVDRLPKSEIDSSSAGLVDPLRSALDGAG